MLPTQPLMHILSSLGTGGTETLCLSLIENFPRKSRHIVVAVNPVRRECEEAFRARPNVRVYIPAKGIQSHLRFFYWVFAIIRKNRPASILVYGIGIPQLLVGVAARILGVRHVLAAAGNAPPQVIGRWKWRIILIMSRILRIPIQACSQFVSQELRCLGVGTPVDSGVIANGCSVDVISARALRIREPCLGRKLIIGMVARLEALKDHDALILAMHHLSSMSGLPQHELWLIGDGPRFGLLTQLVEKLSLRDKVKFLGSRTDVPDLLGRMDIYVFSTTPLEGFGIAIIEAMAAHLPVIASDVPACREVLGGGDAGMLVGEGDGVSLALALRRLLQSENERIYLGTKAYERAKTNYDISQCAKAWCRALSLVE